MRKYPLASRRAGPVGPHTGPAPAGEPGLGREHRLLDMLKRHWWLILAGFVPVFAVTAIYTFLFAPRLYESHASFLLEAEAQEGTSPLALLDRIGRIGRVENELELLRSRRVIAPTVSEFGLQVKAFVDGEEVRPSELLTDFHAAASAPPATYAVTVLADSATRVTDASGALVAEAAPGDTVEVGGLSWTAGGPTEATVRLTVREFEKGINALAGAISADRMGRDADLVQLTCTASTPTMARDLCASVSRSYLELRTQLQVSDAANAREWLTDAATRIEERLTAAEDSLADFARRTGTVALDARAEQEAKNLASLAAEHDLLDAERTALRRYISRVTAGSEGTSKYRDLANFPTFLGNDAVGSLVSNLVQLDNQRAELAVLRSESNPELAAIDRRIGETESQLLSIATSYEDALSAQIESYEETLDRSSQRIAAIPERQVEFLRLQRQVEQLEQMYGTLESRRREAELAEGVGLPSVQAIDAPGLPLAPSTPRTRLNLAFGSVLGLGLGLLLAGYREFNDMRLRSREEVEMTARAPVIGMLPLIDYAGPLLAEPRDHTAHRILRRRSKETVEGIPVGWSPGEWQPAVESFRTLVADLKLSLRNGNGDGRGAGRHDSLAVVSSAQGEGKTFTACNLALVWASMGAKTLLVDADLRMGRVAKFFGMPEDAPGFGEILAGEIHPAAAYRQVRVLGGTTLSVLTSGRTNPGGSDRFHVEGRLPELLDWLRREFDMVIVDTPPLNVVSDATVVSAACDAVVFVVRSGVTRPDALELAIDRLERINGNLVGLVLNGVELPSYYSTYYGAAK